MVDKQLLRVVGWGLFPLPGESKRRRRAEELARQMFAGDTEVNGEEPPQSTPVRDLQDASEVAAQPVQSEKVAPSTAPDDVEATSPEPMPLLGDEVGHAKDIVYSHTGVQPSERSGDAPVDPANPPVSDRAKPLPSVEDLNLVWNLPAYEPVRSIRPIIQSMGDLQYGSKDAFRGPSDSSATEIRARGHSGDSARKSLVRALRYARLGKESNARRAFESALQAAPQDAAIHEAYARFLAESPAGIQKAASHYEKARQFGRQNGALLLRYSYFAAEKLHDLDLGLEVAEEAAHLLPNDAEALARKGYLLTRSGRIDQALDYLERAMSIDDSNVLVILQYAGACLEAGPDHWEKGRSLLKRWIELRPQDALPLASYATLAAASREKDVASRYFEAALKLAPSNVETLNSYARVARTLLADLELSRSLYGRALEIAPHNPTSLVGYARLAEVGFRDIELARSLYKKALESNSSDYEVLSASATFFAEHDEPDTSMLLFEKAIEVKPSHAWIHHRFAKFLEKRDPGRASKLYEKALSIAPNDRLALTSYALFADRVLGDVQLASSLWERVTTVGQPTEEELVNHALFLERQHHVDRAIELFEKAVAAGSGNAEVYLRYARFLSDRNETRAKEMFAKAVELAPNESRFLSGFAYFAWMKLEDFELAHDLYGRAAALEPDNPATLSNYALAEAKLGHTDSAIRIYDQAIRTGNAEPKTYQRYGSLLVTKDEVRARELYEESVRLEPGTPELLATYASFAQDKLRDDELAADLWKRALKVEPENPAYLVQVGYLEAKRNNNEEAKVAFKKATAVPDAPWYTYRAYGYFIRDAEPVRAAEMLKKASALAPRNLNAAVEYTLLLHHRLRRLGEARAAYEDARTHLPNEPILAANFAQLLFEIGDDLTATAITAGLLAQNIPEILRLELEYYWFAHVERGPGRALRSLRQLLEGGARSEGWLLKPNVDKAILDGHRSPSLLRAIAEVIRTDEDLESLDQFSDWHDEVRRPPENAA